MTVKPRFNDEKQLLDRLLRDLPPRAAPRTLESRVLSELRRRSCLPRWRRGFTSWSIPIRAAFVAICGAIIAFTLVGSWATVGVRILSWVGTVAMSWIQPAVSAAALAGTLPAELVLVIPSAWRHGVLIAAAVLYAVLFGLGAAAYQMLYLRCSMTLNRPCPAIPSPP
jgi:hypothetical protein